MPNASSLACLAAWTVDPQCRIPNGLVVAKLLLCVAYIFINPCVERNRERVWVCFVARSRVTANPTILRLRGGVRSGADAGGLQFCHLLDCWEITVP
jgi:hypothetical protein